MERTQSEAVHALRLSCLQDRLGRLRSLVRLLEAADTQIVDQVAKTLSRLEPIDECSDVATLEKGIKPPADDEAAARVSELRTELGQVRAHLDVGQPERAISTATRVLDEARELRYLPLIAEAALEVGRGQAAIDEITKARRALEEAELVAEEAGYAEVRARALVAMAAMVARSSSVLAEIDRAERRARAALSLAGGTGDLEARLLRAGALAKHANADLDAAIALLVRAEAIYDGVIRDTERRAEHSRARLDLSDTLVLRAELLVESRRPHEALIAAERALTLAVDEVGPSHPLSIGPLQIRGFVLREVGRFDEAREVGREVRAFYATERGRELLRQQRDSQAEVAKVRGTRAIRGTIVDAQGAPVANAEVSVATMLVGDSRFATTPITAKDEQRSGLITVRSDDNGKFVVAKAPAPGALVAEAAGTGRSMPMRLEAGAGELQLRVELRPFGSLRGRLSELPNKRVVVQAFPRPLGPRPVAVLMGEVKSDGAYEFERLAEGDYEIKFGTATSTSVSVDGRKVQVAGGRTTEADLNSSVGQVSLEVTVSYDGARTQSSQVALLDGRIKATTIPALTRLAMAGNNLRVGFQSRDGRPARLDELAPGIYTACAIPLGGDHRNPEFLKTLGSGDDLPAHCESFEITESPRRQERNIVLPLVRR